nr:protein PYRICULARIA ORYZAE RESISTANCE 21-like isoform X3 [Coffea arabica]
MRLKVDLQCPSCYKKLKKILCKFPQIRDQVYDEKQNLVTITVVCCSSEKIRDKLCCKGGKVIKSIEIVEPRKSQEPKHDKKPPVPEKPKPCSHPPIPVVSCCVPCLEGYGGGACYCGYWRPVPLPRYYGSCGCGCRYAYGKGYWYSCCDYFSE